MTNKLYIIGNGFDLHHGLKTKFCHFKKYLNKKDVNLYKTIKCYINQTKKNWSEFEENLANLNADMILFNYSFMLPDYTKEEISIQDREEFPNTMTEFLEKLTEGLIENFENFIQEVIIPESANELKIDIDNNARYLSFNYTNTLEKLYNIDKEKILFIHNSAHYGSDSIILGHGIDPKNFEEELPEPPDDIELEDLEKWYSQNTYWDYSYSAGKETIMRYFEKNYKPTKFIIDFNQAFFSDLKSINEIYVLGHSLSKVDLPYFEKIIKSVSPSTKWLVSYLAKTNDIQNTEGCKHFNTLMSLGIRKDSISLFQLKDIQLIQPIKILL